MAVKSAAYHTARIEALHTQLEELEASPVEEYQTDNSGQRMSVRYRKMKEIQDAITYHERKLAKINSKGRSLVVFRRGC